MDDELYTLAYTSTSTIPVEAFNTEVSDIVQTARTYNASKGITGVLFFAGNRFLQILEGDLPSLQNLMTAIEKDSRHTDITRLVEKKIKKRGFESWIMEFYDLENQKDFSMENLGKIREGFDQNELYSAQDILGFYNRIFN